MGTEAEDIASRTASEIGLAFRAGHAGPVELTEYLLDKIANYEDQNIFITVTTKRARKEAQAAAERIRDGRPLSPLDGVPIAWKDLFDVAGAPTTAASSLYRDSPAKQRDQTCVANVAAAGMVCLGKLNMTEFAYSGLGLNPHFGTPVNPNDRTTHRSPGGSSSGSGAAVAAGLAPCAIGTDTGGSVRIPSSLNGTYGLKTSENRIEKSGMVPLSRTLDTIGPLARSVEDCIVLDMLLRGAPTADARRAEVGAIRIVVPENIVLDDCEEAVLDNFNLSLDRLASAGAIIDRRKISLLDEVAETTRKHGSLAAAEAYHEYHALVESERGGKMDPRVVHRIMQGGKMSSHDLLSIQEKRASSMRAIDDELNGALLAMPTTPRTAPEVEPLDADMDRFHEVNLFVLRNTMLGNFLDLCGLAIPNGRDANGLPTSILFSAPGGRDDVLLGNGMEIDRLLQDSFHPTWADA